MTTQDHTKIIGIGFAAFAALFAVTFILMMLVSLGVFVALGITMANETGDNTHAGIGIAGGIVAIIFYCGLALVFVLPPAIASWKILKQRPHTRLWGTLAAIIALVLFPLGTILGAYALWFFFGPEGKRLYASV
jgi:hypothetical protein